MTSCTTSPCSASCYHRTDAHLQVHCRVLALRLGQVLLNDLVQGFDSIRQLLVGAPHVLFDRCQHLLRVLLNKEHIGRR